MMETQVSKSEFKAKALEFFRQIESSGDNIVVTDHGRPVLEVRPYRANHSNPLDVLRGSVMQYAAPTAPVSEDDWDASNDFA